MKKNISKKIVAMGLALMMVTTLLPVLPAVQAKAENHEISAAQRTILKGVYEKLITNEKYKKLKSDSAEVVTITENYEEADDGTATITIKQSPKAEYAEWADGDKCVVFSIDKDNYINCYAGENDYFPALMLEYIVEAIWGYNGMNVTSVEAKEYLFAVDLNSENPDDYGNNYYNVKLEDTQFMIKTIRLYAGGKWNEAEMKEYVDKTWFTDVVIKNSVIEALNDNNINSYTIAGKYRAFIDGNKNDLKLYLATKGSYDEVGWKSIKNLINALKPIGYEDFDYAGEREAQKGNWKVNVVQGEEIPEVFKELGTGFDIVRVTFATPYIYGGKSIILEAGIFSYVTVENGYVKKWTSSNKNVAKVSNDGAVIALKKGNTIITATLEDGTKLTCKIKVKNNPTIKVSGKKFSSAKTYTIKMGKKIKIAISGKSPEVNNKYSSTKAKVAKVISKKTTDTIYIKGLKKGKATVTVIVNGVSFKIKVNVV